MTCPICGETAAWPIAYHRSAELDAWRAVSGESTDYGWRLCRRCGNGYPTAPPDLRVLSRVWEAARAEQEPDPMRAAALLQQRRSAARAYADRSYRLFAPLVAARPGRFLDIACGLGETVRRFADRGWDAEGIDADPSTLAFHRELGIRSRIGQIENLEIAGTYDLIHIAHAIYFMTDPVRLLRALRGHLAPNGRLCIVLSDFLAATDPGLPSYSHSFYPNAPSMRHALALASFEAIFTRRSSGSIYIAAWPADISPPPVNAALIHWLYRTKGLRHVLIGRPALALGRMARMLFKR